MPRKKKPKRTIPVEVHGAKYEVVPSRGSKHIWVHDAMNIKVPELLFDALYAGSETALLDALCMSVDLSQMIRSFKITLREGHYDGEMEKDHVQSLLDDAERDQAEQVRVLSNKWFDLRHEARKRGEKVPEIR